jgi:hypothetical protein
LLLSTERLVAARCDRCYKLVAVYDRAGRPKGVRILL